MYMNFLKKYKKYKKYNNQKIKKIIEKDHYENYKMKKITIFSSLYNCNQYIDNYLNCLKNLNEFENHKLIIWNVLDSNNMETNKKIDNFCENKKNIKLLKKTR